jgi:hypothetical protein
MSRKIGVVHLWDLPEDKIFVKLPSHIQKAMVEKSLEFFKNEYDFAKELGSNQATINDFKNSRLKSTNLKLVKKMSLFLCKKELREFGLENLERQLELIKGQTGFGIENPKFPMNFNSKEGSQIISAFFFDGGIREDKRPFYVNNEKCMIDRTISNLNLVVGNVGYTEHINRGTIFVDFSHIFGIILSDGLEMSVGKRVFTNPQIPEFIINGSKEVKRMFLQQAFDDEGTIKMGLKGRGKRVKLTQNNCKDEPALRLNQIKEILENFGVRVTGPFHEDIINNKRGYTSYRWAIEITNQTDISMFAKEVNFGLDAKKQKLQELLNSYVLPARLKNGGIYIELIKTCKELRVQNQKITNKNIAKQLKKVESYTRGLTLKMLKEGKLRIAKEKVNLGGREGATEREFNLII